MRHLETAMREKKGQWKLTKTKTKENEQRNEKQNKKI